MKSFLKRFDPKYKRYRFRDDFHLFNCCLLKMPGGRNSDVGYYSDRLNVFVFKKSDVGYFAMVKALPDLCGGSFLSSLYYKLNIFFFTNRFIRDISFRKLDLVFHPFMKNCVVRCSQSGFYVKNVSEKRIVSFYVEGGAKKQLSQREEWLKNFSFAKAPSVVRSDDFYMEELKVYGRYLSRSSVCLQNEFISLYISDLIRKCASFTVLVFQDYLKSFMYLFGDDKSLYDSLLEEDFDVAISVLHRDFQYGNVIESDGSFYVIDWESADYGFYLYDLFTVVLKARYGALWRSELSCCLVRVEDCLSNLNLAVNPREALICFLLEELRYRDEMVRSRTSSDQDSVVMQHIRSKLRQLV